MPHAPGFVAVPAGHAPPLAQNEIHLWRVPYAPNQRRTPLRATLAPYLGVSAQDVRLVQGTRGKPRLDAAHRIAAAVVPEQHASERLSFNWSHSGEFALIAIGHGLELGVDIERLGKRVRALELARRFFDPDEADALAALDPVARRREFIALWCAKEAILKSRGEGLSFGLARLALAPRGERDWGLVRADPELGRSADWQLLAFQATPDYHGALAWQGPARVIRWLQPE